jgi:hypothetical protein
MKVNSRLLFGVDIQIMLIETCFLELNPEIFQISHELFVFRQRRPLHHGTFLSRVIVDFIGWGGRDRTFVWRLQRPLPYRLATPQKRKTDSVSF